MAPLLQSVVYSTPPAGHPLASWGIDSSAFNQRTGETHLLSILPAEILIMLEAGPMRLDLICERTATLCSVPRSIDWDEKIRATLDELVQIELADRSIE